MPKAHEQIPTIQLLSNSRFSQPHYQTNIHLQNPATDVMIDLEHVPVSSISVNEHVTVTDKTNLEHLLFAVDDHKYIVGIITIHEYRAATVKERAQHIKSTNIPVKTIMQPFERALCIEMENVRLSKVSNIITTLIEANQHYALVVEKNRYGTAHIVKGFFLASLITRALSSDASGNNTQSQSIADVQHAFRF